jgi:hypothetical protein
MDCVQLLSLQYAKSHLYKIYSDLRSMQAYAVGREKMLRDPSKVAGCYVVSGTLSQNLLCWRIPHLYPQRRPDLAPWFKDSG